MRRLIGSTLLATLALAAPASADVAHTVAPGETLWSIAAANNLTTRTVAAYNGLSEDAQVVLGATIRIPTTVEGYAALQAAGIVPAPGRPRRAAPAGGGGGYLVQPGDTLTGVAAANGLSVAARGRERARPGGVPDRGDARSRSRAPPAAASTSHPRRGAPAVQGAYTVRPGDTLSARRRRGGPWPTWRR